MKTKFQNTAQLLLSLIFEGHSVRTAMQADGSLLFIVKDVAAACGLSKYRDAIAAHLDSDETYLVSISTGHQMREFLAVDASGVAALVMSSRKPAARRFRRWITGEVIPQLYRYGTFLPGASQAERIQAGQRRLRQERAALIETDTAWLAIAGHLTIHYFGIEYDIPLSDKLAFAGAVQALATRRAIRPEKRYLRRQPKSPANAWPRQLLIEAMHAFYYPHCARAHDLDTAELGVTKVTVSSAAPKLLPWLQP